MHTISDASSEAKIVADKKQKNENEDIDNNEKKDASKMEGRISPF